MQINCLIVDDEPLSQEVIKDYVDACPELVLEGVCKDALEAGNLLQTKKIDLILLDINMPKLSGIGFVKSLREAPLFIFITAYPEYALEGFEVDAVDYLVKPVSFERFRTSINRALERFASLQDKQQVQHIMVRADKKKYKLNFDELLYLEAQGDYVKFVSEEQALMVHGTLKDFVMQLPGTRFVRVHKSYVVSLLKVVYLEGNQVKIGTHKIPVSLSYREGFLKMLENKK